MKDDLISRQAALDAVRSMQTYKLFMGDDMILIDKADVQTELMMLPSAQPEPQWIPVSEGLPKKDGRYQVTRHDYVTNTEFIDILWYEKNTWWDRQATGDYAVTAWMPLPERYVRPADAETAQGGLESAT